MVPFVARIYSAVKYGLHVEMLPEEHSKEQNINQIIYLERVGYCLSWQETIINVTYSMI